MITDSQKVALCRKMLEEFWAYSSGDSLDEAVTFLNCLSSVLDFGKEDENARK